MNQRRDKLWAELIRAMEAALERMLRLGAEDHDPSLDISPDEKDPACELLRKAIKKAKAQRKRDQ